MKTLDGTLYGVQRRRQRQQGQQRKAQVPAATAGDPKRRSQSTEPRKRGWRDFMTAQSCVVNVGDLLRCCGHTTMPDQCCFAKRYNKETQTHSAPKARALMRTRIAAVNSRAGLRQDKRMQGRRATPSVHDPQKSVHDMVAAYQRRDCLTIVREACSAKAGCSPRGDATPTGSIQCWCLLLATAEHSHRRQNRVNSTSPSASASSFAPSSPASAARIKCVSAQMQQARCCQFRLFVHP